MFSERLENLIKASLQDGMLTDQEKQAIMKRAETEGEDLNEVEIYIQSLFQKAKQEYQRKEDEKDETIAKEKKAAMGRICPQCGKQIPPLTLKCDCGYELSASGNNKSSVKELAEKIEKIQSEPFKYKPDQLEYNDEKKEREHRIQDLISIFPVPNTKEDIIDFLSLSASKSNHKGGILGTVTNRIIIISAVFLTIALLTLRMPTYDDDPIYALWIILPIGYIGALVASFFVDKETLEWNKRASIWRAKTEQVLMKGRSLRGDPDFQSQLDYYEKLLNKK